MFVATAGSRLMFTPGAKGYGFHLEVRDGEFWRRVTGADNVLVSGKSFDLRPTEIAATETGLAIAGSRTDDADHQYAWQGTVTPVPGTSWFHLQIVLESDGFRNGEHRSVEPQILVHLGDLPPSAEIGLLAHSQSGNDSPAGPQVFSWYLSADHLEAEPAPPAEQDALQDLVKSCLPLLRSSTGYWPERATSWADFATGCGVDLMSTTHSWGSDESGEYLLSYVDGRSDAWAKTMGARGREHVASEPCLESALWALRPIDVLQSAFPGGPYAGLRARLERFVGEEVRRDRCLVLGGLAPTPTPMGSWQYVYILAELWFLYVDRDDDELLARIREEIDTVTIPLARQTQYLFPLQFDRQSLRKIGPGSAYAVCGPYALLMVDLAAKTGESQYLDEARRAIRTLANVPIDAALQEVVLIAQAIDAADRLHELTGESEWDEARKYFRAQTLRMMYWYDDTTSRRVAQASHLGMFLACANINYPAFFENIEADARLAATILAEDDPAATLQILDYGRRTNFSFFPRCR